MRTLYAALTDLAQRRVAIEEEERIVKFIHHRIGFEFIPDQVIKKQDAYCAVYGKMQMEDARRLVGMFMKYMSEKLIAICDAGIDIPVFSGIKYVCEFNHDLFDGAYIYLSMYPFDIIIAVDERIVLSHPISCVKIGGHGGRETHTYFAKSPVEEQHIQEKFRG